MLRASRPVRKLPPEEEPLVEFLERDQLTADRSRPLARARISRRASAAMWALRIFVLIVGAMVIYTFIAHL
jgi:hypothetical protein